MIRIAAQKDHPARHHLFRVDIGHFEAQHSGIEGGGFFEVGYLQDDMAQLADMKVHSLWGRHTFKFLYIDSHDGPSFYSAGPMEWQRFLPVTVQPA